jgi:tetratricopeptide (TPR) repeat protein
MSDNTHFTGSLSRLPFVCREVQLASALNFLHCDGQSRTLEVNGDSGTGKTCFCRVLLHKAINSATDNPLCIYLDVNEDEYSTANVYEYLICLTWNVTPFHDDLCIAVPAECSFRHFLKVRKFKSGVVQKIYLALRLSASMLPGMGELLDTLPKTVDVGDDRRPDLGHVFFEYIHWAAKRQRVIIAIDNYQFLNRGMRAFIESRLGAIDSNLAFVFINRTIGGISQIPAPLPFPNFREQIVLASFTPAETERLVERCFASSESASRKRIVMDCQLKTRGNLKEIELYVLAARHHEERGDLGNIGETLVATIEQLPLVARSIVLLTTIFTAGLKRRYVEETLRKLVSGRAALSTTLHELIALGYVVVNSTGGDTVKAAHEKIITAMRECAPEEELLELRQLAIQTFDEAIEGGVDPGEYYYLLHCLIGILHWRELITRLDRVVELIEYQYHACKFHYVVTIYDAQPDILPTLPEISAKCILDAIQKTSEFSKGMIAVKKLRQDGGFSNCELLDTYAAKYLVQKFHFQDALELLSKMPASSARLLTELNALQSLGADERARDLLRVHLASFDESESGYIILRNAAHLFPFDEAKNYLIRAVKYFSRLNRRFAHATTLSNLGLIYIWNGCYEDAERSLCKARRILESIGSQEVFQSITNQGTLAACLGQFAAALDYYCDARRIIPRELLIDRLINKNNVTVTEIVLGRTAITTGLAVLQSGYLEATTIEYPRLHNRLAYNIAALEKATGSTVTVAPPESYYRTIKQRQYSGYEVVLPVSTAVGTIRLLFSLSPHWRY